MKALYSYQWLCIITSDHRAYHHHQGAHHLHLLHLLLLWALPSSVVLLVPSASSLCSSFQSVHLYRFQLLHRHQRDQLWLHPQHFLFQWFHLLAFQQLVLQTPRLQPWVWGVRLVWVLQLSCMRGERVYGPCSRNRSWPLRYLLWLVRQWTSSISWGLRFRGTPPQECGIELHDLWSVEESLQPLRYLQHLRSWGHHIPQRHQITVSSKSSLPNVPTCQLHLPRNHFQRSPWWGCWYILASQSPYSI